MLLFFDLQKQRIILKLLFVHQNELTVDMM